MRFIISLAFKNLMRYKRRTIITAVAIAVGLMMYIFVDSLLLGAEYESMRNLRWYETSSARIMHTDYREDRMLMPLDVSIEDPYSIISQLEQAGYKAAPRIMFAADLILHSEDFGEDGNMAALVTAVDPNLDNSVFRFADTLVEGRFCEPGTNEVVIGSWFAEDIGAELGYWITLVTRGNGGFYEAMDMQIVGIVDCPNPNVNRTLLMVPIDTISDYLAMEGNATEINIALPESEDSGKAVERIQDMIDPTGKSLVAVSWEELAHDYIALAEAKRGGTGMILFLVFIIAAVTDLYDGRLARSRKEITAVGKFMDPLADKFLVIGALAQFALMGLVNAWLIAIIVVRDVWVTLLRVVALARGTELQTSGNAKLKTTIQLTAIITIIVFTGARLIALRFGYDGPLVDLGAYRVFFNLLVSVAVVFTLYSWFQYMFRSHPAKKE